MLSTICNVFGVFGLGFRVSYSLSRLSTKVLIKFHFIAQTKANINFNFIFLVFSFHFCLLPLSSLLFTNVHIKFESRGINKAFLVLKIMLKSAQTSLIYPIQKGQSWVREAGHCNFLSFHSCFSGISAQVFLFESFLNYEPFKEHFNVGNLENIILYFLVSV